MLTSLLVLPALLVGCGSTNQQPGSTSSAIEVGKQYVAQHGCAACHEEAGVGTLAGSSKAVPGSTTYGPNLTPDSDTGIGSWSDAQIVAALRVGVDDQGMQLCAQMPRFLDLTDDDAKGLVAYLRSLPAVKHDVPESDCEMPIAQADKGKQLVQSNGCGGCHTAPGGDELAGNPTALPNTMVYAPNLTPDSDTGIGDWSDEQLARAIRQGLDDEGATLCAAMPRFGQLSDDDVAAIIAYLHSLAPVRADIPDSQCAERPGDGDDAGTTTTVVDAGTTTSSYDAGTTTTPPAVDAGTTTQPSVDAGTTTMATGDAGWVLVTAGAPLPPAWEVSAADLATRSPSTDALAHVATRVHVSGSFTSSATPCPLPYTAGTTTGCDGFTATSSAPVVVDDYVYLGTTPSCASQLPPASVSGLTGVFDTHYDFTSHVTSYVVTATTCADLGLGAAATPGTASVPNSTDIASTLGSFPSTASFVSVRGVVVAVHTSSSSYTFVIEDPQGGPHSGAVVVKKKATGVPLGAAPKPGDYVRVTATTTTTATGRNELQL